MSVRMFNVGEICVYGDFVCRVDAVERQITGQSHPSLAYMKVPDGTEFNPKLTLTPLYGPEGEPVKKAKPRQAFSGEVARLSEKLAEVQREIERLQKITALLGGLT